MELLCDGDFDLACEIYERIASGGTDEFLIFTTILGAPASKARHRFRRNGFAYVDPIDRRAEEHTATELAKCVPEPFTGNVALGCVFFRPDRQRIDTDNMLKHICDAANGILWVDDSQVTAVFGITEYDPENPRTLVVIGRHVSTMTRGTDVYLTCKVCGAEFQSTTGRKTCSKVCSHAARGSRPLDLLIPCPTCGVDFRRTTKTQRFCSRECAVSSFRSKRRAQGKPRSCCLDCGVELTHTRGGRCRDCWREMVSQGPS